MTQLSKKAAKIVEDYFKIYVERDSLFATDDGNVFLDKNPAMDHARKTSQKWHEIQNPTKLQKKAAMKEDLAELAAKDAEKAAADQAVSEAAAKEAEAAAAAEAQAKLEASKKDLENLDVNGLTYKDALDMATNLRLELSDRKQETVKAALQAEKEKLTSKTE